MEIRINKILKELNISLKTLNENLPYYIRYKNINDKISVVEYDKLKVIFEKDINLKAIAKDEVNFLNILSEKRDKLKLLKNKEVILNNYWWYKDIVSIIIYNFFFNSSFYEQISKLETKNIISDKIYFDKLSFEELLIRFSIILDEDTDFEKLYYDCIIDIDKHTSFYIYKNKYVSRLYKNKKHPFFAAKIICRLYTLYHGMAERVNLKRLENIKNGINENLDKEYPYTTKSSVFPYRR